MSSYSYNLNTCIGYPNEKKLMILGGSRYALPVIKAAHDLGVYVITPDYLPDNIAHKYSDEYCNVSITEKEAVLQKATEEAHRFICCKSDNNQCFYSIFIAIPERV